MIKIRDLHKQFGEKKVLNGVTLDIERGLTTTIFGVSGGGKSTIIKHIVGLLKADKGEILVDGINVITASEKEMMQIRHKVGFLFQSGALFDSMNVLENVAFPLVEHTKLSKKEIFSRVEAKLELVGLKPKEVLHLFPHELSGGMRKRVGLARTIVSEPESILYDEPTSGLDPITSDLISQMIIKLKNELKVTSVLISHDMNESFKCSDKIAMLHNGKIVEYGTCEEIKNSKNPVVRQFIEGSSEGPIQLN
ncbi:MAG: phospholipid/cholesterol/gamma-HCH transport system ATP-binding protein [Campylobacterota bacterium]|nr:phospholipid/cholesterol/gamma-HCH transport system ATP-binding protein [Campylobacterota bacterium]